MSIDAQTPQVLSDSTWVNTIQAITEGAGETWIVLRGFVGPSDQANHLRIYFDTDMRRYVEVLDTQARFSVVVRKESGLEYVWVLWDSANNPPQNVIPHLDDGGTTIVLRGYLVQGAEPNVESNGIPSDKFRLYFDLELTYYLEIPDANFRYGVQLNTDTSPLNLCYIWIDRDADVEEHRTEVNRSYKAGLLEGIVVQDYLGGRVGAGPDDNPAAGRMGLAPGGSNQPGCAPSLGCPSQPGGICGNTVTRSQLPTCVA